MHHKEVTRLWIYRHDAAATNCGTPALKVRERTDPVQCKPFRASFMVRVEHADVCRQNVCFWISMILGLSIVSLYPHLAPASAYTCIRCAHYTSLSDARPFRRHLHKVASHYSRKLSFYFLVTCYFWRAYDTRVCVVVFVACCPFVSKYSSSLGVGAMGFERSSSFLILWCWLLASVPYTHSNTKSSK